jgi:hypothetical protein
MTFRVTAFAVLFAASTLAHTAPTAVQKFESVEAFLARAGRFDLKAHVVSSGAVASDLSADVGVANSGIVAIRMHGTLEGKPDNAVLRTDGVVTMVTKDGQDTRLQPGHSMREAVQLGFLRVGLWHNLLLLSHGSQPEHHEGGIKLWADVGNLHYAPSAHAGWTGLTFDVLIEKKKVGTATLWIDDATKLPVKREQTIVLDGKKIQTIEEYSNFIATS